MPHPNFETLRPRGQAEPLGGLGRRLETPPRHSTKIRMPTRVQVSTDSGSLPKMELRNAPIGFLFLLELLSRKTLIQYPFHAKNQNPGKAVCSEGQRFVQLWRNCVRYVVIIAPDQINLITEDNSRERYAS